ncbi:MAG: flagellar hook-associated protein FlgL [Yersiniaceae bacterium]|uniref:Flagellar hook-filament junction protein FlgL n=1 Tax=Chimaeribacter coloradensis TaxID=2060068 RepID=A0A2N5DT16_9GAMM|nr:flagellar hook-associated protein FlgL [Chimaeribacter coloradensis]MDU6411519.1 flagellar hook-associated protein FlgL [Yersiniaceae bacterium]PLR29460.1 flagellar hook-filament junction protein FlgL [Chimaeribacter coloradensis]
MRVSTSMLYQQNMDGISNSQSKWQASGTQLSTGLRVNKPSDDPMAASQAILVNQAESQNKQYAVARDFANNNMSLEESILGNVTSTIQGAQTLVVSAGNGTLSDDDRASLATQLQGLKDQLLNLANTTDGNGRYIFAGYSSDKAPFVTTGSGTVLYHGGAQAIEQKVDANRTMTVSHTGSQVFLSVTSNAKPEPDGSTPESDVFATLDFALTALNDGSTSSEDLQSALDKANRGLSNSLNNVLSVRSELGTQMNELDTLDSIGDQRSLTNSTQLSNLQDTDWNAAISSYSMQQVALQAAYKTFSDMQGMSLFQLNQ